MRFSGMFEQLANVLSQIQLGDISSDHPQEAAAGYHGLNYVAINAVLKQVGRSAAFVFDDTRNVQQKEIRKASKGSNAWNWTKAVMQDHKGEMVEKNHPLQRLLSRPNPGQTGSHFRMESVLQLRLHGSCLIWNRFNQQQTRVVERYVIPYAMAEPVRPGVDREAPRGGIKIKPVGASVAFSNQLISASPVFAFQNVIIPVERLSIARYPSPYLKSDGHSLTQAISKWIDAASHVDNTRMDFFGIGPDGRIIIAAEGSPEELLKTENLLNQKLEGTGKRVIVISGKNQILSQRTAEDVGFNESYDQLRKLIFSAHGISSAVTGDQDSMTYGAIAAAMFSSSVISVQPDLDLLGDEDTLDLADQYDGDLSIDYSVPPIEDPELEDKRLEADGRVGTITVKEWRTARGREPYGTRLDDFIVTSQGLVDPETLINPQPAPGMGGGMGGPMGAMGGAGMSPMGGGMGGGLGGGFASPGQHQPQDWQFSNPSQISKSLAYNSIDLPVVGIDYGAMVDGSRKVKGDTRKSIDILHKAGCRVSVVTSDDSEEVKKALVEGGLGDLPVNEGQTSVVLYDLGVTQNMVESLMTIVDSLPSPQREQIIALVGPKRSMGYICLPIRGNAGEAIKQAARAIDPAHLASGGYVEDPHVTLLYGITGEQPEDVAKVVRRLPSPHVVVGDAIVLEGSSGKGVPIALSVSGETIHSMHEKVCAEVMHVKTFPIYKPHITLAYVLPEFASLYAGPNELSDWAIDLEVAEVHGEDRETVIEVPLRGMLSKEHVDDISLPVALPAVPMDLYEGNFFNGVSEIIKASMGTKAIEAPVAKPDLIASGLAVLAADTGRLLMLQRALDDTDPASGQWEFPGGHIEDGENPLAAAKREWSEETGCIVPKGREVGSWRSGIYQGFVWLISKESSVNINPGNKRKVLNPDDPDGDMVEVVAWFRPGQLVENSNLRRELKPNIGQVAIIAREALDGTSEVKNRVTDWSARLNAINQRKAPMAPQKIVAGKLTKALPSPAPVVDRQSIVQEVLAEIRKQQQPEPMEEVEDSSPMDFAIRGLFTQISKEWEEQAHPRNKYGRFIDANAIEEAAKESKQGDNSQMEQLMGEVAQADIGKLETALQGAGADKDQILQSEQPAQSQPATPQQAQSTAQQSQLPPNSQQSQPSEAQQANPHLDPNSFQPVEGEDGIVSAKRKAFLVARKYQLERMNIALNHSGIGDQEKKVISDGMDDALARMPKGAIQALHSQLHETQFHADGQQLAKALGVNGSVASSFVRGGEDGGVLHFVAGGSDPTGQFLHGMAHAADWDGKQPISSSQEWQAAWESELSNKSLSNHAASNATEGFAEFARYAWSGRSKEEITRTFPQASAVFEQHKYL